MKCPHCSIEIHPSWQENAIIPGNNLQTVYTKVMICPSCHKLILKVYVANRHSGEMILPEFTAVPRFQSVQKAGADVPTNLRNDYDEAQAVLSISAKACAALSRRVLQAVLTEQGYNSRNLVNQIHAVLNEQDARRALPTALHTTVDAIRNFGNFSAHPITDQNTLEVIDVDEQEAEWCLQIVAGLFDHYYVKTADAERRKAQLNEKLKAAGKPASK